MTHTANQWERNIDGLLASAKSKAEQTKQRAEEALTLLLKEHRPINFKTVAQTAHISTAWLYANEDIKMRIIHLRSQQVPNAQVKIPPKEQASNASKDAMIAALQKRIKEQAEEIRQLKKQLEVAYGRLYIPS
jgi:glucan phosphoethanolaminetransferase (alkaline phosphatase superfamily)